MQCVHVKVRVRYVPTYNEFQFWMKLGKAGQVRKGSIWCSFDSN